MNLVDDNPNVLKIERKFIESISLFFEKKSRGKDDLSFVRNSDVRLSNMPNYMNDQKRSTKEDRMLRGNEE